MQLRPYQSEIIDAVREAFKASRNVLLVSPTGSGKTVMFSYLAKAVTSKGKRVYILVHRDELVDQVSNTLHMFGVPHGFIAAGRPASADAVQVCSVFTLANRLTSYPQPEMLIIDEAHHAAQGSTWARVLGYWSKSFKLGVTATPIRLDGRDLSANFDTMIEGPTVAELIENGDLCKYTMYTPPVVLDKLRMRMGDYAKNDLAAAMDKPSVTGNAVEHYARLASGKRALVFCVSLDHAAHTAAAFSAKGIRAARIDGGMDKKDRRALVASFARGDTQVMTSCDLVSEGFDLPSIEVAVLLLAASGPVAADISGQGTSADIGPCGERWRTWIA
jgi:superfamily II DNA or RNA helicase